MYSTPNRTKLKLDQLSQEYINYVYVSYYTAIISCKNDQCHEHLQYYYNNSIVTKSSVYIHDSMIMSNSEQQLFSFTIKSYKDQSNSIKHTQRIIIWDLIHIL